MAVIVQCVFLLLATAYSIEAAQFTVRNQCEFTVWAGMLGSGSSDGWQLNPGQEHRVSRGVGWTGRFWPRTNCRFDGNGNGRCATGDCNSLKCRGGGVPPATLAEFTLGGWGGQDFYDVSLVDGFNIPVAIRPSAGNCKVSSCPNWVSNACPEELKVKDPANGWVVGCKSACLAWNRDEDCCRGAHDQPQTCPPNWVARIFSQQCPNAYSYAYDDHRGTFTCPTGTDYTILFCP